MKFPANCWFALLLFAMGAAALAAPKDSTVDLSESLRPSPIRQLAAGPVTIQGSAAAPDGAPVRIRVTSSLGVAAETRVNVFAGRFASLYPRDFPGAPDLTPSLLYIDATTAPEFGGSAALDQQAEALIIVAGERGGPLPDLPLVFCDDLIDATGKKDSDAAQFTRTRVLAQLFLQSRAARLMHLSRTEFDLAWFKENATLYEFDHRDRDWSAPLGHRVARGFWQAMRNRWFNATNNHPWDGNPENRTPQNYRPYTFANDSADLVVLYQMLRGATPAVRDNRAQLRQEVVENLLAMQHRGAENFALKEPSGKQQHYTAGAFRYGMFETGEWLTEGKGWFANPGFRDFEYGGVLNGRCVWALGETLKAEPDGPLAARIREAIPLTLRFCLHDALAHRYARLTPRGLPVWGYPGEHGYLTLGMIAAASVAPDLPIPLAPDSPARSLREICRGALDALCEITQPDGTWIHYANVDAVNITALSEGAQLFSDPAVSSKWKAAASRATDAWLSLSPVPQERTAPTPMLGHRKDGGMTYFLGAEKHAHVALYVSGLWLDALASLHRLTGEARYRDRANAILAYYCGANPLRVRLLSELGSVNNRVTDSDGDGIEDQIGWDAYPESTAFVQVGLLRLLK